MEILTKLVSSIDMLYTDSVTQILSPDRDTDVFKNVRLQGDTGTCFCSSRSLTRSMIKNQANGPLAVLHQTLKTGATKSRTPSFTKYPKQHYSSTCNNNTNG